MRAVLQRVSQANVKVAGETVGAIEAGLLVLLGVGEQDDEKAADWLAEKCVGLRIFEDEQGKMNRSILDAKGKMLVVSQFTLYGDCRKGRRPSFVQAADPETGNRLYEYFCNRVRNLGVEVETGMFQTTMDVQLNNQGPVTILLDTDA